MKSESMSARWMGALLGACLLLIVGLAQATISGPVCAPTYGPVVGGVVTLTANCTPGARETILAGSYVWESAAPGGAFAAIGSATAATVVVNPLVSGTGYHVRASSGSAQNPVQGPFSSEMFVWADLPFCSLTAVSPSLGASVSIASGASAVLLATCSGATSIDWYADQPAADTHIPAPAGGIVMPTATTNYYVVGNNDVGSDASLPVLVTVGGASAPVVFAPLCSLTASPLTIALGGTTTLLATCPGATSFTWTGPGVASTSAVSNVNASPAIGLGAGAKIYTVTGTNGSLTGPAASVSVNVSAMAAPSGCTITPPQTATAGAGTARTFTASCSSGSPSSYAWTTTDGGAPGTGNSYTTGASLAMGIYTVGFTAINAGGSSSPATTSTLTVTAVAVPSCTLSPSSASLSSGATAQLFTPSCSGSPTSYAWTVDGAAVGTGSTYTTVASLGVGSHPVTLIASNAGGAGNTAAASITVTAGVTVPGCRTPDTTVLLRNWNWSPNGEDIALLPGQSVAVQFHTGAAGTNGSFASVESLSGIGGPAERYATISTCPGDFTVSTVGCYQDGTALGAGVKFYEGTLRGYCPLAPNTDYYFNIRHANPTPAGQFASFVEMCPAGMHCGFTLQFGHN